MCHEKTHKQAQKYNRKNGKNFITGFCLFLLKYFQTRLINEIVDFGID